MRKNRKNYISFKGPAHITIFQTAGVFHLGMIIYTYEANRTPSSCFFSPLLASIHKTNEQISKSLPVPFVSTERLRNTSGSLPIIPLLQFVTNSRYPIGCLPPNFSFVKHGRKMRGHILCTTQCCRLAITR